MNTRVKETASVEAPAREAGRLKRVLIPPLAGMAIGLMALLIYWPGIVGHLCGLPETSYSRPFRTIDLRIGDALQSLFGQTQNKGRTPRICIVDVTDDDFPAKQAALPPYAEVIGKLDKMGAAVIALDFIPENANDKELIAAIKKSGRVILPRLMDPHVAVSAGPVSGDEEESGPIISKAVRVLRPTQRIDGAYRVPLLNPPPELIEAAAGTGHLCYFRDEDMVVRRVPAVVCDTRDQAYVPLAVAALMKLCEVPQGDISLKDGQVGFGVPSLNTPLDNYKTIPVNFSAPSKFFDTRPYSLRETQGAEKSQAKPVGFFDLNAILDGEVSAKSISGSIVLVSRCVIGAPEEMAMTPAGALYPASLQAMLLHSIVNGQTLRPLNAGWMVFAIFLSAAAVGTFCFRLRLRGGGQRVVITGLAVMFLGIALIFLIAIVLRRSGLILDITPFFVLFGLNLAAGITMNAAQMTDEADRRSREIDLLLVAGRRHLSEITAVDTPADGAIPGSNQMALSNSFSQRTPDVVAETFWQTLPCEGCVLFLISEQSALSFNKVVFHGFHGTLTQREVEAVAVRFAWEALRDGRAMIRSRRGNDWVPAGAPEALRTMMAVPIVARAQPLAVIILMNKLATYASPEKEFSEHDLRLAAAMRYQAAALIENARRYQHEYAMFDGFAQSLAKAVEHRDRYTRGHSERVAKLARGIAEEMGLTKEEIEVIYRAGMLHDLGKIGVSDTVLRKPGRLTAEEFAAIRAHAANGYDILNTSPSFEALLPGIRHHHERYDGLGYPDGLSGNDIPLLARILAAADAYDAMVSDRPYRKALPEARARTELVSNAGTQFDPQIIEAFLRFLEKKTSRRQRVTAIPLSSTGAGIEDTSTGDNGEFFRKQGAGTPV